MKLLKILGLSTLIVIMAYLFALSDYNPIFKNQNFIDLEKAIEKAKKEDLDSIVFLYNKIHETVEEKRCPCEIATTYFPPYRHGFSLTKALYLKKVQRNFTHDDCLKFELMNTDFLYSNEGIKDASQFYFKKNVEQLNDEEKITFIVMLDNPSLYNPKRRKEKVENKVRIYQHIIRKNGR